MEPDFKTDICIIGGGPAGSVTAKRLAELGHNVFVIEKAKFPRTHVGICLSEQTDALLDYIGVGREIQEASFYKRKKTQVKWSTPDFILADQPGMHVGRGAFDQILLSSAERSGARIYTDTKVVSVKETDEEDWLFKLKKTNEEIFVKAKFLVDASGRSNALLGKRIRYSPSLFAMHATWNLNNEPLTDGLMEAGSNSWLWIANLGNQKAMISLYSDPKEISRSGMNYKEFYISTIEAFNGIDHFEKSSIEGTVHACDASSRYSKDAVGNNYIRVGDACLCVDPMASQGVHLAISSSIQAAAVVHTLLSQPEKEAIAIEFYKNNQKQRTQEFIEKTRLEYHRALSQWNTEFWKERAAGALESTESKLNPEPFPNLNDSIQLSRNTQFLETPILNQTSIDSTLALHHPSLQRPIAFLANQNIAQLLNHIQKKETAQSLLKKWSGSIPENLSQQIFEWLWQREIIVVNKSFL